MLLFRGSEVDDWKGLIVTNEKEGHLKDVYVQCDESCSKYIKL